MTWTVWYRFLTDFCFFRPAKWNATAVHSPFIANNKRSDVWPSTSRNESGYPNVNNYKCFSVTWEPRGIESSIRLLKSREDAGLDELYLIILNSVTMPWKNLIPPILVKFRTRNLFCYHRDRRQPPLGRGCTTLVAGIALYSFDRKAPVNDPR